MNDRLFVLLAALLLAACHRQPSITDLRTALYSSRNDHAAAARLLGDAGPAAAPAVPDLVLALRDEAAVDLAIWALGEVGPAAADAIPALLALSVAGKPLRQAAVCIALGAIGDGRASVRARLAADSIFSHGIVRQAARGALLRLDGRWRRR